MPNPIVKTSTKHVLIVEDDRTHQKYLTEILSDLQYSVTLAENGHIAVDKILSEHHFDLLIIDWHMPEMDGLDTIRTIRAWQVENNKPHIPALAFTTRQDDGDRQLCLAAGMDAYIPKTVWMPHWRDNLLKTLESIELGNATDEQSFHRTTEESTDPLLFDKSALAVSREILEDFFEETVIDYITDAEHYIERIAYGVQTQNHKIVVSNAHPLASNSRGMGLAGLASIAQKLEDFAREENTDLQLGRSMAEALHESFTTGRNTLLDILNSKNI